MGTRSNIGREYADGTVRMIYCHWDGYPSNNGRILLENYRDHAEVEALMEKGSLSSLETSIEEISYYVDRGEEFQIWVYENREEAQQNMEEYLYLLTEERTWVYSDHGRDFEPLTNEAVEND